MREYNKIELGTVLKDLDQRYKGRAADRTLMVTSNPLGGDVFANLRTWVGGREARKTVIRLSRLWNPGRFQVITPRKIHQ